MPTTPAEDLPYWRTGKGSPEKSVADACKEIERAGGTVLFHGFARHPESKRWHWLLRLELDKELFRIEWPVLEPSWRISSKTKEQDAKRQAARMLYHDVKAMCMKARALGARTAFFAHVEVEGGKVASQLGSEEVVSAFPLAITTTKALTAGDVIEGEIDE